MINVYWFSKTHSRYKMNKAINTRSSLSTISSMSQGYWVRPIFHTIIVVAVSMYEENLTS